MSLGYLEKPFFFHKSMACCGALFPAFVELPILFKRETVVSGIRSDVSFSDGGEISSMLTDEDIWRCINQSYDTIRGL